MPFDGKQLMKIQSGRKGGIVGFTASENDSLQKPVLYITLIGYSNFVATLLQLETTNNTPLFTHTLSEDRSVVL